MKRCIWFTSDLHFGHEGIIRMCDRPFFDLDHMEAELIKRWNQRVKPNDIVYILGDFIWNSVKAEKYRQLMKSLNGDKILVVGNHDKITSIKGRNLGFKDVIWEAKLKIDKQYILLSHYPYRWGWLKNLWVKCKVFLAEKKILKVKHHDKRPENNGLWLLHGHTHQKDRVRGKQIHIGCDAWDYRPVSFNEIIEIIHNKG